MCRIEGDEIVIRLKIEALPGALAGGPHGLWMRVTNSGDAAKAMVRVLEAEEEDGTTPVHRLFDDAMLHALENGEDGFRETTEEERCAP